MMKTVLSLAAVILLSGCVAVIVIGEDADGRDLIRAMHERYVDSWYRTVKIVQEVKRTAPDGTRKTEVWTEWLDLPGKVRSIVGEPAAGDGELFRDGEFLIFQQGKLVHRMKAPHVVLWLGFDVYLQDPEKTIADLEAAWFDLSRLERTTHEGRDAYVVGGNDGDGPANRFWIDAERLVLVRFVTVRPDGRVMDITLSDIEPLEGGYIATRLTFRRDGKTVVDERYLEYSVPEAVDPKWFIYHEGKHEETR